MKNDMIECYIYAVAKRMPRKQQEDVTLELKGLIEDMLLERCGGEQPTEKDIRVVLTELGSPYELYARYNEDGDNCLIGQPHYSIYKYVLKTMSIPFVIGLAVVGLISQIMEPVGFFEFLENWLGIMLEGLLYGLAAVTLVFAVMYHKGMDMGESFDLKDLAAVPQKKQRISRLDTGFNLVGLVVCAGILLIAPQCLGIRNDTYGWITIFDLEVMAASSLAIGLGFLAVITGEIVKLIEARYNRKVARITLITNMIQIVCGTWWLKGHAVMNPEFLAKLPELFDNDQAALYLFEHFTSFLWGVLTAACLAEILMAFRKAKEK